MKQGVNDVGQQKETPEPDGLERRVWQLGLRRLLAHKVVPVPVDRGPQSGRSQ